LSLTQCRKFLLIMVFTAVYTGGILHSNVHRVVPPPGEQANFTRWSLVFFLRPSFDEELYPLVHESEAIAEAAKVHPTISKLQTGITAGEWFFRRVAGQRSANRKGPESWKQSRGTERESPTTSFAAVLVLIKLIC
jgi:hypothetical protein